MKHGNHDLTPFVGRQPLLAALQERLAGGERLVTVTGLPGVGKSRLVREWVRQRDDADLRVERVALGEDVSADDAAERLASLELDEHEIIWLDDCDAHLDTIAELVTESLDRTSTLTFVLTTRETLGLVGECRLRVPPLHTAEAVDLYAQLAQKAHDGFNAASMRQTIAELVDALDRLPLAIEIAAERVAALPPDELVGRLPDELELLEHRRTPRVERHQSVAEAFEGSLRRLSALERDMLDGCTIFAGGFDMQAAEAVFNEEIDDFLDVLDSLERRSLLRLEASDERPPRNRYMLGNLVAAVATRLHQGDPDDGLKARHRAFFAKRCRQALVFSDLDATTGQIAWLMAEANNISAAARRALEQQAWTDAASLVLAADIVRRCRGPIAGIDGTIDRVIEQGADALDAAKLGELHEIRAERHKRNGRLEQSEEDWSRALELAERAGDHAAQIWLRLRLAEGCRLRSRLDEAAEHLDEASTLLDSEDIACLRRVYLAYRACTLVDDGEPERAREHLARLVHLPPHPDLLKEFECLRSQIYARFYLQDESALAALSGRLATLLEGIDADRLRASYARLRGDLAHARRQLSEAHEFYTDAVQVFRRIGEDYMCGVITASLGGVALLRDDTEQALRCYEESLEIHRRLQRHVHTVQILLGVAALHHEQGRHRNAETHYREAVEVANSTGTQAHWLAWTQMLRGWNGIERGVESAAGWLEKALDGLAGQPYLKIARMALAIALFRRGERDRAEALYEEARSDNDEAPTSVICVYIDTLDTLWNLYRRPGDEAARADARALLERADAPDGEADDQIAEALSQSFTVRVLLSWLRRHVSQLEPAEQTEPADEPTATLEVAVEAIWFRVDDGPQIELARRQAPRRVLAALVEQHHTDPGKELSVDELFAVGWPETEIMAESARNRVYWAIYTLRNLGLDELLQTCGEGYILDPEVHVERVSRPEAER